MPHEKRAGHEAVRIGALTRRRGRYRARDLEYAVVDVETTGLRPEGGARVCEIAVVRMRGDGTVLREFTTLVDPRIKVTGQEFHGIAQGDVVGAPVRRSSWRSFARCSLVRSWWDTTSTSKTRF